jgi:hypothetical protein
VHVLIWACQLGPGAFPRVGTTFLVIAELPVCQNRQFRDGQIRPAKAGRYSVRCQALQYPAYDGANVLHNSQFIPCLPNEGTHRRKQMNKSPEELSATLIEIAVTHVRDMVSMFRRRGVKSEHAMPEVADLLDLSPKRVKSLYYQDGVWGVPHSEVKKIERNFSAYLEREITLSIEYTENLRAKKRQLDLRLECKNSSQRGSGFGSTGSLARLAG